jgi:hypothetical protein
MKKLLRVVACIFTFVVASRSLGESVKLYKIKGSWSDVDSCKVSLALIVETLAERVNIIGSSCDLIDRAYTAQVNYLSVDVLPLISNIEEGYRFSQIQGGYQSKDECEQNVERETTLFRESTNLNPFIAVCFNESLGQFIANKLPWNMRIDALGTLEDNALRPFESGMELPGTLQEPVLEVVERLKGSLERKGIRTAVAVTRQGPVYVTEFKLRGYSRNSVDLSKMHLGSYATLSQCFEEMRKANQSDLAEDELYLTTLCVSEIGGRRFTAESVNTNDSPRIRVSILAATYQSFEDCNAVRADVIAGLERATGKRVQHSFCSYRGNDPGSYNSTQVVIKFVESDTGR